MMMSMFGSVTDAQVFSRELSDQEMIDITGCRSVTVRTTLYLILSEDRSWMEIS